MESILPTAKLREKSSQVVCDEQESMQQSVLTAELKDFIRRVIVPLLVGRYLTKTKTIEHSDALPRFVGDS